MVSAIPYGGVALWAQTLIGLLCLALAGLHMGFERDRQAPQPPVPGTRFFALFFGWTALIAIAHVAGGLFKGTYGSLAVISPALFLWVAWAALAVASRRIASRTRMLRVLITGITILGTIQALIGIIGLYTPLGLYGKFVGGLRAVGTFSSGNSMGGLLALSLPPTLAMAQLATTRAGKHIQQRGARILHEAKREDYCLLTAILWLLATLLQVVALLLSGSRGAITAALVTLVCLCVWFVRNRDRRHKQGRLPAAAAILTLLLVLAIGVGGTYALTLKRLQQLETVQQTALPRTVIWKAAIKQVAHQPFGAGPGRFAEAFLPFQPVGYGNNRVYHAHNDYLEIMSETGIPGLLLLLTAMALALNGATRRLLTKREGQSVWMRRAALLSVFAGLVHAAVDFNLTSRPGVAALFFCLLGVALSRTPYAVETRPRADTATGLFDSRGRQLLIAMLCGLLAANQVRLATATTLMEQGFAAITGETSLYFWLPIPTLTRAEALDRLRLARRLAPDSAAVHRLLTRALVIDNDQRITEAIASAQAETPELPRGFVASQMRILTRMDERSRLTEARQIIDQAYRLAPRNGDVVAQTARISARLAALAATPEDTIAEVNRSLTLIANARELAPNDATIQRLLLATLARLADALVSIEAPSQRQQTRRAATEVGLHLLHLGESSLENILDAWSQAGLNPFRVLDAVGALPADAAVQLYRFYNRRNLSESAMQALEALEKAIDTGVLSAAGFRDASQEAEALERYQEQLIRERARWQLREHQFDAYRESVDARQNLLQRDIERRLKQTFTNDGIALRFRYLNLRKLYETRGLDEQHARELATLMEQHGESESRIANVLAPFQPAPPVDATMDEQPDHTLDMQLLGGRAVFIGFSIREDTIHTFWRFHARVPSDLQVVFLLGDSQHTHVTSAAFRFTQEFGRAFAVGSPPVGKVFRAETRFPVTAALSEHLEIGLRRLSTRRWLPSLAGLSRCELYNWKSLRREPDAPEPEKTN